MSLPGSNTEKWYAAVIYTLVMMALVFPPILASIDATFSALCLPGVCKDGCMTLWGLLLVGITYGVLIRFVPFV